MAPSVFQLPPVEGKKSDDNVDEQSKKPAWKLPSDGRGSFSTGPVMGALSWPALSESTNVASKSTSSPSLIATGEKSISDLNAPTVPLPQPLTINLTPTYTPEHTTDGGGASNSNGLLANGADNGGGLSAEDKRELPALPPVSMKMPPPAAVDKQKRLAPTPQGPHKDYSTLEEAARSRPRGDYLGNYGGNHRGIGGRPHYNGYENHRPHHNGYGNHRYQDHGSQEWRPPASRDTHGLSAPHYWAHPQPFFRPPPPPPPPTPPFFSPSPHFQPFMNPMGFPDISQYDYYVPPNPPNQPPGLYRGMSSIPRPVPRASPPIVVNPALDVRAKLIKQIDYYFSEGNLCHDLYLRRNMDDQGWVPLSLIAGFRKVKELTSDVQFIFDALRFSSTVEVQGEKVRRRDNWMKWILQPHFRKKSSDVGKAYTSVVPMQNVVQEGSSSINGTMGTATNQASNEQESNQSFEIISPSEIVNCDTLVASMRNVGLEGSINIDCTRDAAINRELNEQDSTDFVTRLQVGDTHEGSDVQNQAFN